MMRPFESPHAFCCLRLPRIIKGGSLSLRRLTILDSAFLRLVFEGERPRGRKADSVGGDSNNWWKGVRHWWWARNRYNCVYTIRVDGTAVGLMGLYDLRLGEPSAVSLTLLIPEEQSRGKGYGTEAYALFMNRLAGSPIIKDVKVALDNPDQETLLFWQRKGFGSDGQDMAEVVLVRHLRTTRTGILVS